MKTMKKGDKVYFGRGRGEKTLGEIVKVNPKSYKVKQLESRGTSKAYAVGTVWTVPHRLATPAEGGVPAPAPMRRTPVAPTHPKGSRPVGEVLADINRCYSGLSPENLHCDGEASMAHVRRMSARLNRELRALFVEYGREVGEVEAYRLYEAARKAGFTPAPRPFTFQTYEPREY